jgi:pimeloyl-ACP methyl ester carboxylesterase
LEEEIMAAYQAGDLERINELEATYWLDGCYQEAGRADASIRQLVLDMNGIVLRNGAAGIEATEEVLTPKAWARVDDITQPTVLIWGDLDEPIIRMADEIVAERLADARLVTIAGTAHLPSLDAPAEYNRILSDFLEEVYG